jgi:hypothetical protein
MVTGARTSTLTSWLTAVRPIPCLRATGGDWNKEFNIDYMVDWSKDFIVDYMVDCHPRVSLSEGRSW